MQKGGHQIALAEKIFHIPRSLRLVYGRLTGGQKEWQWYYHTEHNQKLQSWNENSRVQDKNESKT